MKKIIAIGAIIIILGLAGYIFVARKSATREVGELISQKQAEAPSEFSSAESFDTNDNLDQALQDLDQLQVLDQ